jgi:beta-lactamase class A
MNLNELRVSRRAVLRALPAVGMCLNLHGFAALPGSAEEKIAAIEKGIGARLGVAALDTGTGRRIGHRADERFAMCSTFKLLLAGCILSRVDAGNEQLSRRISYTKKDLLEYAPLTGKPSNLQTGSMTIADLCAAAVELSDNTAANLLLAQVGGPAGLTGFIRSLGNQVTRLDRTEPELNTALPGDPRDTTSPDAMVDSMEKLLVRNALSVRSQTQLADWLQQSTTGAHRLRAGIPKSWRSGDKTGTGERGAIGDTGIFWPPQRKPILIAAYVMEGNATQPQREQAIASVGRVIAGEIAAGA